MLLKALCNFPSPVGVEARTRRAMVALGGGVQCERLVSMRQSQSFLVSKPQHTSPTLLARLNLSCGDFDSLENLKKSASAPAPFAKLFFAFCSAAPFHCRISLPIECSHQNMSRQSASGISSPSAADASASKTHLCIVDISTFGKA